VEDGEDAFGSQNEVDKLALKPEKNDISLEK